MTGAESAAAAVTFLWLGMVLAISFLEAPLKFTAPGVTPTIGLAIGRRVFRALNGVEAGLAAIIVVTMIVGGPPAGFLAPAAVAVAMLGVQLAAVRPRLTRRSDAVLSGAVLANTARSNTARSGAVLSEAGTPRSRSHHAYIALEVIKVLALLTAGVAVLAFPG